MWNRLIHWQKQVYKQAQAHRAGHRGSEGGRVLAFPHHSEPLDPLPFPDIHQGVIEGYQDQRPGVIRAEGERRQTKESNGNSQWLQSSANTSKHLLRGVLTPFQITRGSS